MRRITDHNCSREKKKRGRRRPPSLGSARGGPVIALRPPRVGPIEAVEQHGQLRRTQGHAGLARAGGWPAEGPLLEALVDDDEAVLVPVQQLDAVAALVAKHEDVSGQGIGLQVLADLLGQAVKAAPQIDRLAAEPDADGGRKAQHGGTSSSTASSCRNVAGSKPGGTRTRRPPVRTTSTLPARAGSSSGTTRTGTKWAGACRCCNCRRQP